MSAGLSLSRLLDDALQDAGRFFAVLTAEHAALVGRDAAVIEQTAAEKQGFINALENKNQQRIKTLRSAGFEGSLPSLASWLAAQDKRHPQGLGKLWDQLTAQLARCDRQNQTNGSLINLRRQYTQRALSILLGSQTDTNLYARSGDTVAMTASRSLAKA